MSVVLHRRAPPPLSHTNRLSMVAGLGAVAIGATALLGWALGLDALKGLGGPITMKANTAVGLMACGLALVLISRTRSSRTAAALAVVAGTIGGLTLLEHLSPWNLGIDQLLFKEAIGAAATASPGRMGPNGATSLVLLSVALWCLRRDTAALAARAQWFASAAAVLALLALTGYWYGAQALYSVARITGIAFPTAVAFMALSIGIILVRTDVGPVTAVMGNSPGSAMARHLLPAAIALPLVVGYLRVLGQRAALYDTGFGSAMFAIVLVVTFVALIWRTAQHANTLDRGRRQAETALQASEQSFAAALQSLPIAAVVNRSDNWQMVEINDAFADLTGYSRREIIGRTGFELGLDHGLARRTDVLDRIRAGETVANVEAQFVAKSGDIRDVLTHATSVWLRGTRHTLWTAIDITERKRAEMAMQAAREAAESANRQKDQFLATVSHELRTPLNAILGYTQMLQNGVIAPDKRWHALEIIERNAVAQTRLVEDLLDLSRVSTGRLRLEPRPMPVAALLADSIESLKPAVDAKGILVELRLDPNAGVVNADEIRLRQVFWNVLSNAVKFTPAGGQLHVALARDGDIVQLAVRDTGIGVDPAFLPYVFEPFQQADPRYGQQYGGLGLGLAICKHLVELHGGTITASSDGIGSGTVVIVRLPRHASSPDEEIGEPVPLAGPDAVSVHSPEQA